MFLLLFQRVKRAGCESATARDDYEAAVAAPPGANDGTAGNDALPSSRGDDSIDGGDGDDSFESSGGNDFIEGGAGSDRLSLFGAFADFTFTRLAETGQILIGDKRGLEGTIAIKDIEKIYFAADNEEYEPGDLVGFWGTAGDDPLVQGNWRWNLIYGLAGNDFLRGLEGDDLLDGGTGVDTMEGGAGDDTYLIDDGADAIVEGADGGLDTLQASVSYALAAGVSVETLVVNPASGTAAINLFGNEVANSIYGNEGANILLGGAGMDQLVGNGGNDTLVGGDGIDVMRGGLGNDLYGIDEGDLIYEAVGEGDDTLAANIGSYFLTEGASIESLTTANQAGTIAQNLTGNEFGQSVSGSAGANVLNGLGGIDLLRGYGGADIFLFDTAADSSTNYDVIADMQVGMDKIALQNAVFTGLSEGNLGAGQFVVGTAAFDADDRIIWDQATNQLFFDSDGNGANAAVLFAIVNGSPNLQASDFMVI